MSHNNKTLYASIMVVCLLSFAGVPDGDTPTGASAYSVVINDAGSHV